MYVKRPISPHHRAFRRVLLGLAFLAFLFAGFMSFFYVGQRSGYLKHEDIAPTVFATDVYLYQTKAYWADQPEKFQIAGKLIEFGFFDRQYYYAGREMMTEMAENGYDPAVEYVAVYFPPEK